MFPSKPSFLNLMTLRNGILFFYNASSPMISSDHIFFLLSGFIVIFKSLIKCLFVRVVFSNISIYEIKSDLNRRLSRHKITFVVK